MGRLCPEWGQWDIDSLLSYRNSLLSYDVIGKGLLGAPLEDKDMAYAMGTFISICRYSEEWRSVSWWEKLRKGSWKRRYHLSNIIWVLAVIKYIKGLRWEIDLTKVFLHIGRLEPLITWHNGGFWLDFLHSSNAFELWCWRRLLRVPWTARRSNQSILKEINPGCSLEEMMLKLKLQYFGHLMRRVDSLEKTLMLGGIGGRRRGQQRMRWLDGITHSMDMSLSELGGW